LTKSGEGEPFAFVELTDEELDAIEAMESAPNELLDFFQPITTELLAAASRVVQTMRWVLNLTSSGRPVSAPHFSWSYDAQEWWPVSAHDSPINPLGEGDVVILSSTTGVVQAVLGREGFGEPLGRQLLYEAVDLLEANPRAALVLAIVAAEVGLKDFAGGGAPERTWLLSEVATPPIVKMIREYLPILTDTRTHDGRVMPKAMTSTLQRGVERRNEIVHRGLDAPDEEDLRELIETVNDFLYALDWLAGHKWAFGRMREETQREWR
jgi:hypothetical protein